MRLLPDGPPVLVLAPTANWPGKCWPAERFASLAERLTGAGGALDGGRVAVCAAAWEREDAEPVLQAVPAERRVDLVGGGDLNTLFCCLQRAQLFVGNDSGLMHMAAAAGVPTLGLFGPSRDELYGPWGELCAAVRTPQSFDELIGAPDYDRHNTGSLMTGLEVETAATAAERLLQRAAARSAPNG